MEDSKPKDPKPDNDWKTDPRLAYMDKNKLQFLSEFSERIHTIPQNRLLPFLFSLKGEAARRGINFSDSETMLIISVLNTDMTPEGKKRIAMLQSIAKKLAK